jgi:uncharacterized coiled-coil protein SlyX
MSDIITIKIVPYTFKDKDGKDQQRVLATSDDLPGLDLDAPNPDAVVDSLSLIDAIAVFKVIGEHGKIKSTVLKERDKRIEATEISPDMPIAIDELTISALADYLVRDKYYREHVDEKLEELYKKAKHFIGSGIQDIRTGTPFDLGYVKTNPWLSLLYALCIKKRLISMLQTGCEDKAKIVLTDKNIKLLGVHPAFAKIKKDDFLECLSGLGWPLPRFWFGPDDVASSVESPQEAVGQEVKINIPHGTNWNNISIILANDEHIEIHCGGKVYNKAFNDIGFSDKRKKDEPNSLWILLKLFAENRGEIRPQGDIAKKISTLRKKLQAVFHDLTDDPICYDKTRKTYKTVFSISSRIPIE